MASLKHAEKGVVLVVETVDDGLTLGGATGVHRPYLNELG